MSKYGATVLSHGHQIFSSTGSTRLKVNALTTFPVVDIAISADHTAKKGSVYTWGKCQSGQLGYQCDSILSTSPKEVLGALKKVKVVSVAVSKYHTAALSASGVLYTWGISLGQLGYEHPINSVQIYPRRVGTACVIIAMACTDSATGYLSDTGELLVIANGAVRQVFIPSPSVGIFRRGVQEIKKLVGGASEFAVVTMTGNVYLWTPFASEYAGSLTKIPLLKPHLIWHAREKGLVCVDVALGASALVIATASGHVFTGTKRGTPKMKMDRDTKLVNYFKFVRVDGIQHCVAVSAGGGKFGCVRRDFLPDLSELCRGREDVSQDTAESCGGESDVEVVLDGGSLYARGLQLRSCSLYFEAILRPDSPWTFTKRDARLVVHMSHVPVATFRIIIDWITAKDKALLFTRVEAESSEAYIKTLMDLIQTCDEFLVEDLVHVAGEALVRFLTLDTCLSILEVAVHYNIKRLVDAATTFSNHFYQ